MSNQEPQANTLDEKMKEVGFNEHERLLIARLYKPVIAEARIEELGEIPPNPNFIMEYIEDRIAQLKEQS